MGTLSLAHWAIVAAVFLLVFGGRNRVSSIMGDVAPGELADDNNDGERPTKYPSSSQAVLDLVGRQAAVKMHAVAEGSA